MARDLYPIDNQDHGLPTTSEHRLGCDRVGVTTTTTHPTSTVLATHLVLVETRIGVLAGEPATDRSNAVRRACAYHLNGGGRRIRARLALHGGLCLGMTTADAVVIAAVAELLHNASLIHDDLQDRDRKRHEIDTVWVMFGDTVALCAGDLMLSAAYGALADFSRPSVLPELIRLTHAAVGSAVFGQAAETAVPPKRDPRTGWFEAIAARKSGSLLSLPLELALAGAGHGSALALARRTAEAFAIGYQIADDIKDASADATREDAQNVSNFVLALNRAGMVDDAVAEARCVATRYLLTAARLADGLPDGSGDLLKDLARQCAATL